MCVVRHGWTWIFLSLEQGHSKDKDKDENEGEEEEEEMEEEIRAGKVGLGRRRRKRGNKDIIEKVLWESTCKQFSRLGLKWDKESSMRNKSARVGVTSSIESFSVPEALTFLRPNLFLKTMLVLNSLSSVGLQLHSSIILESISLSSFFYQQDLLPI